MMNAQAIVEAELTDKDISSSRVTISCRYIGRRLNGQPARYSDIGKATGDPPSAHFARNRRCGFGHSREDFDDIFGTYGLERTIERALEIVSEAAKALPPDLRARHDVVQWRAIIAIGNRLRHEYHRLSPAQLREIATVLLPAVRPVVLVMMADLGRED